MGMKNDEIVCLNCSLRVCVCEIYYSAAPAPAAAVYGNKTTLLRDSSTQHHAVQSTAIIIRPNIYKNTPRPFSLSWRATSPAQSKLDALIPSSCCSRSQVMRRKKIIIIRADDDSMSLYMLLLLLFVCRGQQSLHKRSCRVHSPWSSILTWKTRDYRSVRPFYMLLLPSYQQRCHIGCV